MASGYLLYDAGSSNECPKITWGVGWGRKEVQEGGDICIPIADSCWCMAETNTTLLSNYPPIKNKLVFFKKKILQLVSINQSEQILEKESPIMVCFLNLQYLRLHKAFHPRISKCSSKHIHFNHEWKTWITLDQIKKMKTLKKKYTFKVILIRSKLKVQNSKCTSVTLNH